ncbi:hypothetical protein QBC34DRAFT_337448 [Podospora aff. communis PSN243]|uniref:Secreted protein n=1 Tax=Podospora aff. communis PSN243 TaxID=3040156 RepID=A0AAV9G3T3_9PEZI|nr:hypothetical protein QBC34DRAFT_337448 [Podospora aff. communis PSN243]
MHLPTLLLLPALAAAATSIPGYTIVPQLWEIEVAPGQIATLNGTVQEVIAQAKAINPNYTLPDPPATVPRRRSQLSRREVKFCNNFGRAEIGPILEGVRYLKSLGGQASLGPGPGRCSRVSCSWDSAIYWCNDNTGSKSVTWDGLANSAAHITEVCPWVGSDQYQYVSGQNFERTLWNTLVREDDC